jgi:hypothetical protein
MSTNTPLDSADVHNELSPLLTRMEVLIDMCLGIELGRSPAAERVDVLITVLDEQAAQLRTRLESLCGEKGGD